MSENKLLRMDNVGIVVESLENAIPFFTEPGPTLEETVRFQIKNQLQIQ